MLFRVFLTLLSGWIVFSQEGPCQDGWKRRIYKCYRIFPVDNYERAKVVCGEMTASVTKVTSPGENDFIATLLANNAVDMAFIGLSDELVEGVYKWQELSLVDYSNWYSGVPPAGGDDADCVVVKNDGFWHNVSCDQPQSFVCEKKIKTGRVCGLNGKTFDLLN